MSASTPYGVSYSPWVQEQLRRLLVAARGRGGADPFLIALAEFDRLLRVYPQFGEPLTDLRVEVGQIRLGVIPPLVMRYGVLEERRVVLVVAPPALLSGRAGG